MLINLSEMPVFNIFIRYTKLRPMIRTGKLLVFASIMGIGMLVGACAKKGGEGCVSGTWNSLDDCIQAKIANGVDDECDCKTDNYPDGPWYMVPDD